MMVCQLINYHVCVLQLCSRSDTVYVYIFTQINNFSFYVEQQFNQIEKQLISCNARLESEQKQHERLQKEHEETGKPRLKCIQTFSPLPIKLSTGRI